MRSLDLAFSRRQLVRVAVLTPLLSVFGYGCSENPELTRAEERFGGLLRYPKIARQLGNVYLSEELTLQEATAEQLTDLIIKRLGMEVVEFNQAPQGVIKMRITEKVSEEFKNEDVVSVDGWLLARTEAQLLALIKLSAD